MTPYNLVARYDCHVCDCEDFFFWNVTPCSSIDRNFMSHQLTSSKRFFYLTVLRKLLTSPCWVFQKLKVVHLFTNFYVLWLAMTHNCVHKGLPLEPLVPQFRAPTPIFCKISCNIIHHCVAGNSQNISNLTFKSYGR